VFLGEFFHLLLLLFREVDSGEVLLFFLQLSLIRVLVPLCLQVVGDGLEIGLACDGCLLYFGLNLLTLLLPLLLFGVPQVTPLFDMFVFDLFSFFLFVLQA
jgi:hypothetical protein